MSNQHHEEEHSEQRNEHPKKRGPKPGTEAARRGGLANAKKYGRAFYIGIGHKGGESVKRAHEDDLGYYHELGRRGGETTRERHGSEHYARIGRMGGRISSRRRHRHTSDQQAPDQQQSHPRNDPMPPETSE